METNNVMLEKEQFLEIMSKMNDLSICSAMIEKVFLTSENDVLKDSRDASGIMFAERDIVIELLELLMRDKFKFIELFVYNLDFGRGKCTDVLDENEKPIDISTSEKLYDYLVERM